MYLPKRFVDAAYLDVLWRWCRDGFCFSALFVLQEGQAMIAESNSLVNWAGAVNGASILEDGHREVLAANPLGLFQEGAGAHALGRVNNDELADHLLGLLGEWIRWVLEDSPLYPHVELIFARASERELACEHCVEQDAQCPQIDALAIILVLPDNLWAHIRWRPTEDLVPLPLSTGFPNEARKPKVYYLDHLGVFLYKYIIKLYIPMRYSFLMQIVKTLHNLLKEFATCWLLDNPIRTLGFDVLI
jgi:hypothetical protein